MLTVLSIAGFDPSGGAGTLADIKTFAAFGCYGTAVITSITSQNTVAVYGAYHQSGEVLLAQLDPVISDFEIAAIKTGMLPTLQSIEIAAEIIKSREIPNVVVDTVIRSTSGYDLIDGEAIKAVVENLLPLADVITPNMTEAERIVGFEVRDLDGMKRAARVIREMSFATSSSGRAKRAVLLKGGHLDNEAADVLDDGKIQRIFRAPKIATRNTHGTGCTLSSAIAALLAKGFDIEQSVARAKDYVSAALLAAPGIGHGAGPLDHFPEGLGGKDRETR